MSFYNKYLKYKNKYIQLKNQLGGLRLACNDESVLNNRMDTCWNAVIQMAFLFGDQTSDTVQTNIEKPIEEIISDTPRELLECLPIDFFIDNNYGNNLKEDIVNNLRIFFKILNERFLIKYTEATAPETDGLLMRSKSIECENNFTQYFKIIFYKYFTTMDPKHFMTTNTGYNVDIFFMILLFSILLYKRRIYMTLHYLNTLIIQSNPINSHYKIGPIDISPKTLAICAHLSNINQGHVTCFYKCVDSYKYYDSSSRDGILLYSFNFNEFIKIINSDLNCHIFQYVGSGAKIDELNFINNGLFIIGSNNMIYYKDATSHNIIKQEFIGDIGKLISDITRNINYYKLNYFILITEPDVVDASSLVVFEGIPDTSNNYKNKYMSYYLDYYIFFKDISLDDSYDMSHDAFSLNTIFSIEDIKNKLTNDILLFTSIFYLSFKSDSLYTIYKHKSIQLILNEKYVDINVNNGTQQYSPLLNACYLKNIDIVEIILSRSDLDINAPSGPSMINSLIQTITYNNFELVNLLLDDKRINVNIVIHGDIPLWYAIKNNYLQIVELLLTHPNININILDKYGFTPLIYAIRTSNNDLFNLLISHSNIDINQTDNSGDTPLVAAINTSNNDLFSLLISHSNIDINQSNIKGDTPLIAAINMSNNYIALKLLSIQLIDVNKKSLPFNETPLLAAINKQNDIIALELLKNSKIDINIEGGPNPSDPLLPLSLARMMNNSVIIDKISSMIKT
jgi:ankyrin repeat protein